MKDSSNRDINYMRLALTSACNLRCDYCMPKGIDCIKQVNDLSFNEFVHIVEAGAELGINKIRLTGGEPLIYPNLIELINKIKSLPNKISVHITTNGILLKEMAKELVEAGVDSINISMDSLDRDKYREITRGGALSRVLNGIKALEDLNFNSIKINTVLMKGVNDNETDEIISWAIKNSRVLRFIEMMPIGEGRELINSRGLLAQDVIENNPLFKNIIPNIDGTALSYKIGSAKIGFITPLKGHFCDRCNKIRINSKGELRQCLMSDTTIPLKDVINSRELLVERMGMGIKEKPESGNEKGFQDSCMYTIGG